MEHIHIEAFAIEPVGQFHGPLLAAAEHQHQEGIVPTDQGCQCLLLVLFADLDADLVDGGSGGFLGSDVDDHRIGGEFPAQLPDFLIQGGGTDHGLMDLGHQSQESLDILSEALAEHLVHFVQYQVFHPAQAGVAFPQVVQQPSRSPHQHLGLVADFPFFFFEIPSAAHRQGVNAGIPVQFPDLAGRLLGQFPGRRKDQGLDEFFFRVYFIEQGDHKGQGLPHPCLGTGDHVPPVQKSRDGTLLHRRRDIFSSPVEFVHHCIIHFQLGKACRHGIISSHFSIVPFIIA